MHTHTQTKYYDPRCSCVPRVNKDFGIYYIIICKPSTTNCNSFRVTWFVFLALICGIYHIIIIIFSMQINPGILYLTLQFLQPLILLTQCTLPPIVPSRQEEQEK